MRTIGELGVLSDSLAEEMAHGARFRNVLSHTHGNIIDHDIVGSALQDLVRYRTFVQAVRASIESIDAVED